MAIRAPVLVLAILAAGCIGDEGGGPAPQPEPTPPGAMRVDAVTAWTLHLTPALGLWPEPPVRGEPVGVPIPAFYDTWIAGGSWPSWATSVDAATVITNASLAFHYRSEGTTPTTGPQDQGFPEFVVYLGASGAFMGWASVEAEDIVRDQAVSVEATFELPVGGLVLLPGDRLQLLIVPVQGSVGEGTRIEILTNSTGTPSVLTVLAEPVQLPRIRWTQVAKETVQIVGSAYVTQEQGLSTASVEVSLPPDAVGLRAHMARTGGVGGADLDLALYDPNGGLVARSVTPRPVEETRLLGPNVAGAVPGRWRVEVGQYGGVLGEAEVTVWVARGASNQA